MTPTRDKIEKAKKFIEDSLVYISNDCGIGYNRSASIEIDEDLEHSLKTALAVLTQALEPRCEYQRGTHCNLPNGAMQEVNRKMMIAVAEENKRCGKEIA